MSLTGVPSRVVGFRPGLLLLLLALRFLWERQVAKSALAGKHARRNAELVAFVVYPTVVYAAFAAFNCRALRLEPPVSVLLDDDRVRCEGSRHRLLQAASLAVIAAVGVGAPLYLSYSLHRKGRAGAAAAAQEEELARKLGQALGVALAQGDTVIPTENSCNDINNTV